jgi:hypothetical protein
MEWVLSVKIIDWEKPKYPEINLRQYHFVHHKSSMTVLGLNPDIRCQNLASN